MVKINNEFHEIAEPCRILPSGSPQVCSLNEATNYVCEDGTVFPIDAEIITVSMAEVADMFTALSILGVEE